MEIGERYTERKRRAGSLDLALLKTLPQKHALSVADFNTGFKGIYCVDEVSNVKFHLHIRTG